MKNSEKARRLCLMRLAQDSLREVRADLGYGSSSIRNRDPHRLLHHSSRPIKRGYLVT